MSFTTKTILPAGRSGRARGAPYDGTVPFPGSGNPRVTAEGRARVAVTAAFVIVPFAGLAAAVWLAWGHGLGLADLWPLALLSLGESWHNGHHSDPGCARHGTRPRQIDISAAVIGVFARLGWATAVHWPDPARLAARRLPAGPNQPQPEAS
ncbi:MAG: hypothetical protein ACRDNF_22990 [Streptosporangiaceae bacterium]